MTDMLFEGFPTPEAPPEQTAGERIRARQDALIAAGVHPLNRLKLAGNGHSCGDCVHRYLVRLSGTYPKCELGPDTRGAATDVRAWWPACVNWSVKQ